MVEVAAINMLGQKTILSANEMLSSGNNEILFSTNGLNTGLYLYTVKIDNQIFTGKMQVIK